MQNSYCHKEMNNNTDNTLYSDASILDALKALECSAEFNYTLFLSSIAKIERWSVH